MKEWLVFHATFAARRGLRRITSEESKTLPGTTSIQKQIAVFLLIVFALSATPKVFFHDLLANHKDAFACNRPDKNKPCLHTQAYHCAFDDLVVTAPYLATTPELSLTRVNFSLQHICFLPAPIYAVFQQHSDSRGPPSMH